MDTEQQSLPENDAEDEQEWRGLSVSWDLGYITPAKDIAAAASLECSGSGAIPASKFQPFH